MQQQKAAEILVVDPVSYHRYEKGIRKPTAEVAARIEKLTNGAVPATSWYEPVFSPAAQAS